jgi:hypothetical protein
MTAGMTSHGQMALRRRAFGPRAEIRLFVMGVQFTRALRSQQWPVAGLANSVWTVA